MPKHSGLLPAAKFGLIIVLFLMPFINVSCSGMVNIPLSGMDLATGKTLAFKEPFGTTAKTHRIEPQPYASLALACAVLGLLVGFVRARPARLGNAVLGGGGAAALLLLRQEIDNEVLREGRGLITVEYQPGFWIVLLLFLAALAVGIWLYAQRD